MVYIQFIAAAVALVFCMVIGVQNWTLGFARTSALLITSASLFVLVAANAADTGLFKGTHLIGVLTAAFLPWWSFVRVRAAEFQN